MNDADHCIDILSWQEQHEICPFSKVPIIFETQLYLNRQIQDHSWSAEVTELYKIGKENKTIHRPNRESENLEGNGDFAEHMNHVLQKKMDELIAEQI